MATSAVPDVLAALVTQADAAISAASVYYGTGVTDDPGNYLMIGVDDPDSTDASASADSSQTAGPMGTNRPRDELGTISCVAMSWNGDGDQKAAVESVFATTAALEDLLRADPTLAIPGYQSIVVDFGSDQRLQMNQDSDGAEAAVFFSVRFRARI